ncbi:hypothetical protein Tco_1549179 [Tanacetum coccineum]
MGGRVGRGARRTREPVRRNNETISELDGQGNDRGVEANGGVGRVLDFSIIIAEPTSHPLSSSRQPRNVIVNNDRRGCTYKEFLACNLKEYDGKGGAIVYTRWIEKMESVQDMSGCGDNQKEEKDESQKRILQYDNCIRKQLIMSPSMTTRSASRSTAALQGGGTDGRVGNNRGVEVAKIVIKGMVGIKMAMPSMTTSREMLGMSLRAMTEGCTYKEFLACNLKEYDGKGGAIVYTRWIEKMESVQDMSGCRDNQNVKYTAGSFVGKASHSETLKSTHEAERPLLGCHGKTLRI